VSLDKDKYSRKENDTYYTHNIEDSGEMVLICCEVGPLVVDFSSGGERGDL